MTLFRSPWKLSHFCKIPIYIYMISFNSTSMLNVHVHHKYSFSRSQSFNCEFWIPRSSLPTLPLNLIKSLFIDHYRAKEKCVTEFPSQAVANFSPMLQTCVFVLIYFHIRHSLSTTDMSINIQFISSYMHSAGIPWVYKHACFLLFVCVFLFFPWEEGSVICFIYLFIFSEEEECLQQKYLV